MQMQFFNFSNQLQSIKLKITNIKGQMGAATEISILLPLQLPYHSLMLIPMHIYMYVCVYVCVYVYV